MRFRCISLLILALAPVALTAGTIDVSVKDSKGSAVREAVVFALGERSAPPPNRPAIMDQKDRMFVPHVLVIQSGTTVRFPNSDDIGHHVYSFSPAKSFQLPLYKGTPTNPIVFDKAGVVTLGCNIHDRMSAFIIVVDTPYFGKTDENGRLALEGIPPGRYMVNVWYPDVPQVDPLAVEVKGDGAHDVSFVMGRAR